MNIPSADDFILALEFEGHRLIPENLELMIQTVHQFAANVWENPQLTNYVDHGVRHSLQGLQQALDILSFLKTRPVPERLSDVEKAILCVGALLHDIGMQAAKYQPEAKPLSPEKARKKHVKNGYAMFHSALSGGSNGEFSGLPKLGIVSNAAWLTSVGADIGFAHSGSYVWKRVVEGDWSLQENRLPLRPKMLAAAFRLADEIDNAHNRIVDVERLHAVNLLKDETAAHWGACHYIHEVNVIQGSAGIFINVIYRIPEGASAEDKASIKTLLRELRIKRMEEERERVEPFLKPNETLPGSIARIQLTPIIKQMPAEDLPPSIVRYVRKLHPAGSGVLEPSQLNIRVISKLNDNLELATERLDSANAHGTIYLSGHIGLRTEWHTNRYYRCDELLSDPTFMLPLVDGLFDLYKDDRISDVLGIGTAGIRLGSRLAARLGIRFHFTFSQADTGHATGFSGRAAQGMRHVENYREYPQYELRYALRKNSRVLIVDDIVGVGSALHEILSKFREKPATIVRIFSLLALGNRREFADLGKPDIDVLLVEAGTKYWEEDREGYCEQCSSNKSALVREDGQFPDYSLAEVAPEQG